MEAVGVLIVQSVEINNMKKRNTGLNLEEGKPTSVYLLSSEHRNLGTDAKNTSGLNMASAKELLTVPLTRKYGSMPSLAQKSMISLEYKGEGFMPRRISGGPDLQKTGNKQSEPQDNQGFPLIPRSSDTPAKTVRGFSYRRENGWRSPLLERRQTMGADQEITGAAKTPNMDKTAVGSASKRRLHEDVKFSESRHSEWLSRISAFNNRLNGAKTVNASAKTGVQIKEQTNNFHRGQDAKGIKSKKTPFAKKKDNPNKTVSTNKNTEKYSQVFSLEKEIYFQDYRQKCIQWLKSLPDSETQFTSFNTLNTSKEHPCYKP